MILDLDTFFELRKSLPVVDVRSEGEFAVGHIPSAVNIPILTNEERAIVGTMYKREGQKQAIRAGFRLVGPRLAELIARTEAVGDEMIVHCWRGGMRSGNFCQFAAMAQLATHQLGGGYKAYRQRAVESFARPYKFHVLAGHTGSGKSEILRALKAAGEQVVDLEALASHKGSVFGGLGMPPQPTTEQFQNDLFEQLRLLDLSRPVWVEDESIAVGAIFLPLEFWRTMGASPVVVLDVPRESRIDRLVHEYGRFPAGDFIEAMEKIVRKLGGQHFNAARDKVLAGDLPGAIEILLTYYDKAYQNGIERKSGRVIGRVFWDGAEPARAATELAGILQ